MLDRTLAPPVYDIETIHLPTAEVETLPNGTRVHYLPNSTQAVIRFEMIFPAGKWFESQKGVSYFTSKLLMEGTRSKSARQLADFLDFYGASLECNQGFDWATITLYCLSKYFPVILPVVQEILTEAAFPEKELAILKTRTSQNLAVERLKPAFQASEKFSKNVFGSQHPYATGLTDEEIAAVDREKIISFYTENYTVSNAEIIISGDIQENHKTAMDQAFATAMPANLPAVPIHTITGGNEIELVPIPDSLQAAIRMGGLFPLVTDSDYLKLTVVNKILGGYFGSRLMKNIREDKGYTYGVYSTMSVRKHATLFFVGTDVKADSAPDSITQIKNEMLKLQNEKIDGGELLTVQNYMIGKFLNEINTVFDQADKYKHILLYGLPDDYYNRFIHTIKTITPEEILDLSRQYLNQHFHLVAAGYNE